MNTLSVSCTMRDGKLRLYDRRCFDDGLRAFNEGEDLTLTIQPTEAAHSDRQRRFFHGPVLKGFMALGYQKQEAKDMLALRFIPRELRQMDGTVVLVPGHTSDLTKQAYTEFIEACIQLAAEHDVYIEDADVWRAEQAKRQKGQAA